MKINTEGLCGTSLIGYITAVYSDLEKALGKPMESDGYKVSGEWVLDDENGGVFTIYDWKSTELYDTGCPTVKNFRASIKKYRFHIGSNTRNAEKLAVFLSEKLGYEVNYRDYRDEKY
jgi:hypothetical protein